MAPHLQSATSSDAGSSTRQHNTEPNVHLNLSDIGKIIDDKMSFEAVAAAVKALSVGEKYHLLKDHFVPPTHYEFPSRFLHQCQRCFQSRYLRDFPWMVCSPSLDAAFCKHCALMMPFEGRKNKGAFVNKPCTTFHKLYEKAKDHQGTNYYNESMIATECFLNSVDKPEQNIDNRLDDERKTNIQRNRHIIKCVAEVVLYCGCQCIALHGDKEDLSTDGNKFGNVGKFLAALQMIANHDEILKQHLYSTGLSTRNVKYTSPSIQNQVIEIIGQDIILSKLVKEIKAAKFYSIMADEVTSHNKEELALCARFVDDSNEVREEFLAFLHLPRITGKVIADKITTTLHDMGLEIANIRGQGYDGAANMSSDNVGVQRRIREQSPNAVYVHCSGHCLNLVISHSCALPNIRNAIDKLKQCSLYFLGSPKREGKPSYFYGYVIYF